MKKALFLTVFIYFLLKVVNGQTIHLNGTVFGYISEKMLILKKAQKNVSFEGSLDKVKITISSENYEKSITTDASGNFSIPIENQGNYTLTAEASGYSTIRVEVNYEDAGNKTAYGSLFILLKKEENSNFLIGKLSIANDGKMDFEENNTINDKLKTDVFHSNANLIKKSTQINNTFKQYPSTQTNSNTAKKENKKKKEVVVEVSPAEIVKGEAKPNIILLSTDADSLRFQLDLARGMLVGMDTSSLEYKILINQIQLAEQQLNDKEVIITLQETQISAAKKIILYVGLFGISSLLFVGLLLYFLKQRKVHTTRLKEKNKKISKINSDLMSSIRYAALIQSKFLQDAVNITKLFPDSFIYNRPKDLISGDFYWFSKKNGYNVIVLADCTGHGVPGGLLTILGHSTLEELVNIQGETSPEKIILGINKSLTQTFSKMEGELEYGMDLTVISIKEGSTDITLSGVVNGVYVKTGDEMKHHYVTGTPLGPELSINQVGNQTLNLKKGDCIFLFSDGYHDQFNRRIDKIEKFNVSRFETLLKELGCDKDFQKAEIKLDNVLNTWKGERTQTDDILILGIRL
ncbi:MAG: SpoIIE family protein phosphatase [Flavobacteriales bacterium]